MKVAELKALKKQLQVPLPLLQPLDDWQFDDIDEGLDLNELMGISEKSHSYLVASDDALIELGISAGDTLIIDHKAQPKHKQLVVASVEGQLVCRTLDFDFNQLTCEGLEPIELDEYANCIILGVVCSVLKLVA